MSMLQRTRRPDQQGFTLIELLIATTVFSIILLVITASVLQFTKQYYKGLISSSTQNVARTLVDDITRAIQFNGGTVTPLTQSGNDRGYCVGNSKRYSYTLFQQVKDSGANTTLNQGRHGLVSDSMTGCNSTTSPLGVRTMGGFPAGLSNPRELLGEHMRISKFNVTGSNGVYTVTVKVVYGDNDLLTNPTTENANCKSSAGSQFCAVSELTTTVNKRINQ
ncbi:MAG TPA: prepilin-type N-terminal cleavage/methylation domain-containing protein [Candidatus Saccharimonadales bacterium]